MIIPSIDIMDGKAVQLQQGKKKILEKEDIFALAKEFSLVGEIAVIDLDAAMGKGTNKGIIMKLCSMYECRVGGGIRDLKTANEYLKAGASKIIIGTKANPEFLSKIPRQRLIAAIDTLEDKVVTEGWVKDTGISTLDAIARIEKYVSEFLFTDVKIEGMMSGINEEKVREIVKSTTNKVTIAGGISSIDEIRYIEDLGANSQLGMSIYTGQISLNEAFVDLLDFEKGDGIIPTIVQELNGQVLMQAYSTRESLLSAIKNTRGVYYSRSRKEIWKKGDTSGNTQELIKVRYDCDRDTILFTVKQEGVACHTGAYSCFEDQKFQLQTLYDIISNRIEYPMQGSYTSQLVSQAGMLEKKLQEEIEELIDHQDRDNLIWEIADVTYFLLVMMAKNDIKLEDVMNELRGRRK